MDLPTIMSTIKRASPVFYQKYLAMSNTWQVVSPSLSDRSLSKVNAINPLVAFYEIH
jgi:hypothetical protein